jgi:GNAT superfamily N-acetyltransferase
MNAPYFEITSRLDERLPEVLDIYQESFPLREQMRVSWWLRFLRDKEAGEADDRRLVVLAEEGRVAAFAYYELEARAGYLWYLATRADLRGGGLGARLFNEVREAVFAAGRDYLLFEVELPEEAARFSAEEAALARRRIAWYQKHGALLVGGVEYIQDVGWQPPYPMALMIAPRSTLSQETAWGLLEGALEDSVRQVGEITLS